MTPAAPARIVDPHVHLYDLGQGWYPALTCRPEEAVDGRGRSYAKIVGRNYLLDDYRADSRAFDVRKVVHVSAAQTPSAWSDETRWLQGLHERCGLPQAIVGAADLTRDLASIRADLREHALSPAFRGIRNLERIDYAASHTARAFEVMLGLDIRLYDLVAHLDEDMTVLSLVRRFPEMGFVLEHCGWPSASDGETFRRWRDGLAALAEEPNVSCKISGIGLFAERWSPECAAPYVVACLEAFGASRCMFASNFPVDSLFCAFDELFEVFAKLTSDRSEEEREALFAGNAERTYCI